MSNLISALGNVVGAVMGSNDASKNRKAQYDFAQRGIQWKVADAKKAGIHPLAALGMQGAFYSPVASTAPDFAAAAGQDLSRAVHAGLTARQRRSAEHAAVVEAQFERDLRLRESNADINRTNAETELLRSQIARLNQSPTAPAPNPAPPGSVDVLSDQVTVGDVGAPERSPGVITDYSFGRTADGGYSLVPSQDIKNRIEDTPMEWGWMLRNGIVPNSNIFNDLERRDPAGVGYMWRWNPFTQQFFRQRDPNNRSRRRSPWFR